MALGSTCAFNPIGFCFGSILPQPQEWPKLFGRLVLHVGRQGACKLASGWGQFSGKTPSYPFLNSTRLSKSACWLLLTDYQQIFYHSSTWAFFVRPSPSRLPKPRTWLAFTKKIRLWWNEEFMVWEDSWRVPKNCWSFWSQPYLGQLWSPFTGCWSAFAAEHAAVFQAFGTQTIDPVKFYSFECCAQFSGRARGQRPNID